MLNKNNEKIKEEGISWKRCANPFCDVVMYRKDYITDYHFFSNKFHDYECSNDFHNRLNKEINARLRETLSKIKREQREQIMAEWGL